VVFWWGGGCTAPPHLLRQPEGHTMEDNPYQSPSMADRFDGMGDRSIAAGKKLRGIVLLSFYLLAAANGAMQASQARSGMVSLVLAVMAASLATYGCVVDARLAGRPIVQSLHWIMFFTWPIAVPIYLIYSRKLRGVVLLILHGIVLIVVSNVAFYLTWYLSYSNPWFGRSGQ
jgi:hypothetical protein